jgi:hypothetical protein
MVTARDPDRMISKERGIGWFLKKIRRMEQDKERLPELFKKHADDIKARRRGTLHWYVKRLDLFTRFLKEIGLAGKDAETINIGSGLDAFFWPSGLRITHIDSSKHLKDIAKKGGTQAAKESAPSFVKSVHPEGFADFLGLSVRDVRRYLRSDKGRIKLADMMENKALDTMENFLKVKLPSIKIITKNIGDISDEDLSGKKIAIMKGNLRNYAFGGNNYEPSRDPSEYLAFLKKLKSSGVNVILSESKDTDSIYLIGNKEIDRLMNQAGFLKLNIPPKLKEIFDFFPKTKGEERAHVLYKYYRWVDSETHEMHESLGSLEPASNVHAFIPSIFIRKDHPQLEEIKSRIEELGKTIG